MLYFLSVTCSLSELQKQREKNSGYKSEFAGFRSNFSNDGQVDQSWFVVLRYAKQTGPVKCYCLASELWYKQPAPLLHVLSGICTARI